MADLKKKLNEAETEFKNVPKVEEMEDLFLMKMPTELRRIKEEYESMENALADALKDYTKATELFGENPTVMQPEQLFGTVASFIDLWEVFGNFSISVYFVCRKLIRNLKLLQKKQRKLVRRLKTKKERERLTKKRKRRPKAPR